MATPQIPWARVLVEGVVIVASILLALTADAWWDERQEREDEQDALGSLLQDFEENGARVGRMIAYHERVEGAAADLLALAVDESSPRIPEVLDSLLYDVFVSAGSVNVTNGALQALLSSGRLGIVRNDDLRTRLADWPSWVEENAEDEQWLMNDVQQRLTPYLNSRVPARNVYARSPGYSLSIPASPAQQYEALWSDPAFENLVAYRLYGEAAVLRDLRLLGEQAETIVALLRAELSP